MVTLLSKPAGLTAAAASHLVTLRPVVTQTYSLAVWTIFAWRTGLVTGLPHVAHSTLTLASDRVTQCIVRTLTCQLTVGAKLALTTRCLARTHRTQT